MIAYITKQTYSFSLVNKDKIAVCPLFIDLPPPPPSSFYRYYKEIDVDFYRHTSSLISYECYSIHDWIIHKKLSKC